MDAARQHDGGRFDLFPAACAPAFVCGARRVALALVAGDAGAHLRDAGAHVSQGGSSRSALPLMAALGPAAAMLALGADHPADHKHVGNKKRRTAPVKKEESKEEK